MDPRHLTGVVPATARDQDHARSPAVLATLDEDPTRADRLRPSTRDPLDKDISTMIFKELREFAYADREHGKWRRSKHRSSWYAA